MAIPERQATLTFGFDTFPENSKKVYSSLATFGAPLTDISDQTFKEEGIVFQIGIVPRRIDIITHIDGARFKDAYESKEVIEVEGLHIPFVSRSYKK